MSPLPLLLLAAAAFAKPLPLPPDQAPASPPPSCEVPRAARTALRAILDRLIAQSSYRRPVELETEVDGFAVALPGSGAQALAPHSSSNPGDVAKMQVDACYLPQLAPSAVEMACVLGHELAHIVNGDGEAWNDQFEDWKRGRPPASGPREEAGLYRRWEAENRAALDRMNRDFETAADRQGTEYVTGAYPDADAAAACASVLRRLARLNDERPGEQAGDHPSSEARAVDVRRWAEFNHPTRPRRRDPPASP